MSNIPRKEYPRPQFVRENWMNLNGTWAFEIDNGRSGEARGLQKVGTALSGEITVPFCPESELSGVQHTDFMYGVWYKRTVTVTEKQLKGRAVLHFGAVDYCAKVFVNGELVGTHKGGYVSFEFDVTALLKAGENEIAVYAEDNTRDRLIPSGKQSEQYNSYGCFYTRTTGIWQTVWLEFTPKAYISRVQYYPNITTGTVTVTAELVGTANLTATASFEGKEMGSYTAENACDTHTFTIKLSEKHLWDVGCGNLYVTVNYDENGICEVFTNTGRHGGCPSQSEATARLVSIALRSGVSLEEILDQLRGIRCPSTIRHTGMKCTSCPDAIARVVKKTADMIAAGQKGLPKLEPRRPEPAVVEDAAALHSKRCPECGAELEHEGGCASCRSCGYSKCN